MPAYYFEPTAQLMTEQAVAQQIGQVACDWCPTRQAELGLYHAYFDHGTPYNKYIQTLSGSTWTRFETLDQLKEIDAEAYYRLRATGDYKDTGPFYLQRWSIIDLDGEAETSGAHSARLVVTKEAARLLASLSGLTDKPGCPDVITDYVLQILNLANHSDFPSILATEVDDGSFASWPTYPDLANSLEAIANSPVDTNADIVFKRIISSYSVPGTYSEKVSAIEAAVKEHGVDGTVNDLYNFAVNMLNK